MCLSAIRQSENPPKYGVAIHCTIVQKRHSDPKCLPIPMRNMPGAIYVPSTLLKHPVKCISPQGSSVQLVLPHSCRDQQGVHSPSVSEQAVSHSRVSILTTSLSFRALQFGSSGVPWPVERPGLQSGSHASNSSQRNTVHRRRAFPSQSHPLNLQAHLKRTTSPDNTSHRVNGIPALQGLEVWIQFSHSSQFASPHYFLSCTNETHQKSQNSKNSVRAGHCLMVSPYMLGCHTTQGGYSIGFRARQCWCSDPRGWDSHFWPATSWPVWNRFNVASRRWQSWRSLQLLVLWLPRVFHWPI